MNPIEHPPSHPSPENLSPEEQEVERVAEARIREIDEGIAVKEKKLETETPGWFKKYGELVKRAALAASIAVGSFTVVGCNESNESSGEEVAQSESVEQQHSLEEQQQALNRAFDLISGNMRTELPNGNLAIRIGGGTYYELDASDLKQLLQETDFYLDRADQFDNRHVLNALDMTLRMKITDRIVEIGDPVALENLPEQIQEMEQFLQEGRQ